MDSHQELESVSIRARSREEMTSGWMRRREGDDETLDKEKRYHKRWNKQVLPYGYASVPDEVGIQRSN